MIDRSQALDRFGLTPELPVLSVIGGSQGSRVLNALLRDSLDALHSTIGVQVIWQTGSRSFGDLKSLESGYRYIRIYEFVDDMGALYSASDLVVSRAGALALAEITHCGKPAILIPFSGAAADHQTANARVLENAGAAIILNERELSAKVFVRLVRRTISDAEKLSAMGKASRELASPGASERITQEILALVTP